MASATSAREALRNRQFALVWGGQTVSRLGDGIMSVALPLLVLMTTRSATDLGVVVAARLVPTVVFLLLGGALTDRVSRRRAMMTSDLGRGVISAVLGMLALAGALRLSQLLWGAILFGVSDALFYPASVALVPEVVAAELLTSSNSLNRFSATVAGGLLGPLVGGVVASTIGVSWSFVIDAGSFGVSALCLIAMRPIARPVSSGATVRSDIRGGLAYCRRTPWLMWSIAVAGVANALVFSPAAILLPLFFKRALHAPNWMVGVGFAATGLGGLLGAVVMMSTPSPRARVRTMWLAWLAAALLSIVFGLSSAAWLASCVVFAAGALLIVGNILWDSLMQTQVPPEMLGRVSSVDWTFSLGLSPLGVAAAGAVSNVVGVRATIVVPALVVSALGVVLLVSVRSITALDRRPPHDAPRYPDRAP